MLYVGLDLSRKRLDWHPSPAKGSLVEAGACARLTRTGWTQLVRRLGGDYVSGCSPSWRWMNGRSLVHDQLELRGWDVRFWPISQRRRALAPLACKTDRIDAWVLAELARRDLIPEVWLPDPAGAL